MTEELRDCTEDANYIVGYEDGLRKARTHIEFRSGLLKQLKQCVTATWDGDITDKMSRDILYKRGFLIRCNGYNSLSEKGLGILAELDILKP